LGDPVNDGTTVADDLESRTRELRALTTSIDTLRQRVKSDVGSYWVYSFLTKCRYGKGGGEYGLPDTGTKGTTRKGPESAGGR